MMFSRKTKKVLSIFLLINIVVQCLTPTMSYALTGGPKAPEFSSFEPVDTTDMVNLASGDFIYNLPLIEVPGPEGGYPMSLSYHAGIKLDQEASWVGLGFTLNPGAINRTVGGFPDDNVLSKRQVKDYWGGGNQTTQTYNLSLSYYGIGVNYSLANTTDTYKGFSTNSSGGLNVNFKHSVSASLNFNGKDANASLSVNPAGYTTMGISISSKGLSGFASVAGQASEISNGSQGSISSITTQTDKGMIGFGFLSYSLKDYYTRYWSDETQGLYTFGALYPGLANASLNADFYDGGDTTPFNSFAFDSQEIFDNSPIPAYPIIPFKSLDDKVNASTVDDMNDVKQQIGGSLPAYDRYEVLGQGIGGIIQPFIFENGDLYGQNLYFRGDRGQPMLSYPTLQYKSLRKFSEFKKVDFRFLNDFSNSLTIDPSQVLPNGSDYSVNLQQVHSDPQGFNNSDLTQKLAGSRHVEWFTNEEIYSGDATTNGFVDFYNNRQDRKLDFDVYENYLQPEAGLPYAYNYLSYGKGDGSFANDTYTSQDDIHANTFNPRLPSLKSKKADLKKKIGGFMITNETGVVYHYALPVYSYNEYTRSKLKKPRKGVSTFREYKNTDPYAYTWLLTAITGPDYVDKNGNGVLDDQDYGYWVKFDYGCWADAYQWRTPHTGYADDVDSEYATFSYGIKELYYLDAVETRTHKAIFVKSKRNDARGVTSRLEGGSNPRQYNLTPRGLDDNNHTTNGQLSFPVAPVSTMKLDGVYLFDKKDLVGIPVDKARGEMYNEAPTTDPHKYYYTGDTYTYTVPQSKTNEVVTINGEDFIPVKYHNGDLVFDNDDIHDLPEFIQKAQRVIQFTTDYSLASRVPNSFGFFGDQKIGSASIPYGTCSICNFTQVCNDLDNRINKNFEWPDVISNKCVAFNSYPYACQQLIDGAPFLRDNSLFYSKQGIVYRFTHGDGGCSYTFGDYAGNTLEYPRTGKLTLKGVKFLGKGGADLIPPITFAYDPLKNPAYQENHYDEWGFYKSDYIDGEGSTRRITPASSQQVDAWSLSSITTSLGGKINISYEANQYQKSVYNDFSTFSVEKLEAGDGDLVNVYFKEKHLGVETWFAEGQKINLNAFFVCELYPAGATPPLLVYANHVASDMDIIATVNKDVDMVAVHSQPLRDALTQTNFNFNGVDRPGISYLFSGFAKANDPPATKYAGGIRVKTLEITDEAFGSVRNTFTYTDPSTGLSSGVTSFKPFHIPSVQVPPDVDYFGNMMSDPVATKLKNQMIYFMQDWQGYINSFYKDVLTFSTESIPPGVLYGCVTETTDFNGVPHDNYSEHHFKTFDANLISKEIVDDNSSADIEKRLVTFKTKIGSVGSLVSTKVFDNANPRNQLSGTNYGYLLDGDVSPFEQTILDSKQGLVEQSFHKNILIKKYDIQVDKPNWFETTFGGATNSVTVNIQYSKNKALVSLRQDQADAVTSIEHIDYKRGITTVTKNLAFDPYSGQATDILTSDSYGNSYLASNVPAYHFYPSMGLKVYDVNNKNMLAQGAATYNYVLEASVPKNLISASVQTWSDQVPVLSQSQTQTNIWRKQASYNWDGQSALNIDGTYPISDFTKFDPAATNSKWLKTRQTTLYDAYSHELEATDINGNFASMRMDPKQIRVIASTTNAAYAETAYSGVEFSAGNTVNEGDVNRGDGNPSNLQAHTGKYSLLVGANSKGFNYTLQAGKVDLTRKYRASVWMYAPNGAEVQSELNKMQLYYSINGVETIAHPTLQKSKSKSWYLINLDIDPTGNNDIVVGVRNSGNEGVYFDDFRIHPLDASMVSYVYDPFSGELNYMLDANNIYSHYEYDDMGRLIRTSREQLNYDFGNGKESFKPDHISGEVLYNYKKN